MNSPSLLSGIQYKSMPKKNKQNKSKQVSKIARELATLKLQKSKTKRKTPFGDVGSIVGKAAGSLFGYPQLGGVGKWLGTGIGSIFGSGDYSMSGPAPKYNVLQGQIPKFSSTHATNVVCHREYLGDVIGTSGFNNLSFPLNPGMGETFPWLSTIAANYQQYKFHGLIFEFRPLITDFVTSGAPGVIVMTTNYNADQDPFSSRQEAENAEFAVSVKPTLALVHMIECADPQVANKLYNVRTTSVPLGQDLRLYDYGLTQVITQLNPNQDLGELWVSYCVEFFKPTLAISNNLTESLSYHSIRSTNSGTNPLGLIQVSKSGSLNVSVTGTTITLLNATPGASYKYDLYVTGTTIATTVITIPVITGGNFRSIYTGSTVNYSSTGTASLTSTESQTFIATSPTITMIWPAGSTLPSGTTNSEIWINTVDPLVT